MKNLSDVINYEKPLKGICILTGRGYHVKYPPKKEFAFL
jgi:hypothetical protein